MKSFFSRVGLAVLMLAAATSALTGCATTPLAQHGKIGVGAITLGPQHRPHILGAIQYTATHRSSAMTDLVTAMGATGTIMILTGAAPSNVATVDSGTVLAVLTLSATPGTVSAGVLTFNSITSAAASNTGTAAHFLICTTSSTANCVAVSSTTRVMQGAVGTSGSDLNYSGGVSFTSGETISISSFTITANGA